MSDEYTRPSEDIVAKIRNLTQKLTDGPLDLLVLLDRGDAYNIAGYPDLAAADAYVGLTLIEAVEEEDEIDEDALLPEYQDEHGEVAVWPNIQVDADTRAEILLKAKLRSLKMLVETLVAVGCLRDAWTYYQTFAQLGHDEDSQTCQRLYRMISDRYRQLRPVSQIWDGDLDQMAAQLPSVGLARREIYPWNEHEPDRTTKDNLRYLNDKLKEVAPDLEVRTTELPDLSNERTESMTDTGFDRISTRQKSEGKNVQLGLFATRDLKPGTVILREKSFLTATRDAEASLCDACAEPLPELGDANPPIACEECQSVVFCGAKCHEVGMYGYHGDPATYPNNSDAESDEERDPWPFCTFGLEDLTNIGRDPTSTTPSEDLYVLLFTRAVAMAEHRHMHPLDLDQTRWLWGEFLGGSSLPWTLKHNVILPLSYFSLLMQSSPTPRTSKYKPYSAHWLARYDFWVLNTLYAKFRGVASARQSTWDGKPEVAGVHWRWCLANHSCAPGVRWVWGGSYKTENKRIGKDSKDGSVGKGEIVFVVRDEPVWTPPERPPRLGSGAVERPEDIPWPLDDNHRVNHASGNGPLDDDKSSNGPIDINHVNDNNINIININDNDINNNSTATHTTQPSHLPHLPHLPQPPSLVLSSPTIQKENRTWTGIKADQEILSHYCDIGLDVRQRREWARGALGGICRCRRCVVEAAEEDGIGWDGRG